MGVGHSVVPCRVASQMRNEIRLMGGPSRRSCSNAQREPGLVMNESSGSAHHRPLHHGHRVGTESQAVAALFADSRREASWSVPHPPAPSWTITSEVAHYSWSLDLGACSLPNRRPRVQAHPGAIRIAYVLQPPRTLCRWDIGGACQSLRRSRIATIGAFRSGLDRVWVDVMVLGRVPLVE